MTQADKSSLLDSLKIERSAPARRKRGTSPVMLGAGAAGVIMLALGAWFFWPDSRVSMHVVTAQAEGAAGSASGLDASGYVVARRKATLSAKILGKVIEVNFEEGQRVRQGDVVARLDDSNYVAALRQAEALQNQARAAFNNSAPIYARYQSLKTQGAISADAVENQRLSYDNARTAFGIAQAQVAVAQSNLRDTVVRAPFDGVVTVKVAQVGEVVAPQAAGGGDTRTGIVTIVDMDSLEVQVDVAESYIERVEVGGAAVIHLEAYPELEIPGSVIAIIPTADQSKGTVQVRVAIKKKDSRILPQMAARVGFMTAAEAGPAPASPRISVPPAAVMDKGRTGTVFIVDGEGLVERREVALGRKTPQAVVIQSGVSPGERLASGELGKLQDGMRIKPLE